MNFIVTCNKAESEREWQRRKKVDRVAEYRERMRESGYRQIAVPLKAIAKLDK